MSLQVVMKYDKSQKMGKVDLCDNVYNDSKHLTSSLTEIEPHIAKIKQPEESKEIAIEKIIREVTWNSKILKNMSKYGDSNFLVMFSFSKA